MLDAIDVLEEPDDLSIMCYVSFYRGYLKNNSAFAPLCYAEGPGLTNAVTSKPAEFTVFAVNQAGERSTTVRNEQCDTNLWCSRKRLCDLITAATFSLQTTNYRVDWRTLQQRNYRLLVTKFRLGKGSCSLQAC